VRSSAEGDRNARTEARGKFLWVGGEKLYVKGVTYGTFRPDDQGGEFHDVERVARDFEAIAKNGFNAVRTYTVPPRWLLETAAQNGLRVMAGIPWEQHVAFLDERDRARSIVRRVEDAVKELAGHPALLTYAIGNEIPSPIVRWHGRERIEGFLETLYWATKQADPDGLTTYVNYPSTEYLELPFLDVYAFNVYLETQEQLDRYLPRLQSIAGDRPLLLAELGLDSRRNGLAAQAESLDWQIGSTFAAGAAGTFVFAWTDEWHRGGADIEDWDFGLTDRSRHPKPALDAVRRAYASVPLRDREWPLVSVVVCSYNGAATIGRTCEELHRVEYPAFEVIVVDDGSTDDTAAIASEHGYRVISTTNRGLAAARNTGLEAARGIYVAYLDDDAWPDPHWLTYLVQAFEQGHGAVGGPNIPPLDESPTAQCVARSPGGPVHVLFDDTTAEHVPGCNLAIRRDVLTGLGGFDPLYRVAGDDVDLCWRVLERGDTIGFAPGAMVWHRRRATYRGYLRQQMGYGRAEALLEREWPEKYNLAGHPTWSGTIYGHGTPLVMRGRWRVYYGGFGLGPFQRLYAPAPGIVGSLPLTPEWWLVLGLLTALSFLSILWTPLLVAAALLILALTVTIAEAAASARQNWVGERPPIRLLLVTCSLTLLQPLARLVGRVGYGLRPWWRARPAGFAFPRARKVSVWSETWASASERLGRFERHARSAGIVPIHGTDYDRWDFELRAGLLGGARVSHTIEEHGAGRQLMRFSIRPKLSVTSAVVTAVLAACSTLAAVDQAAAAAVLLALATVAVLAATLREAGAATALSLDAAHACDDPGLDTVPVTRHRAIELTELAEST
jgi:GT2 family glycosyltransferase